MRRFIRRWKYTITAVLFIIACVGMLFFAPLRWLGAIALAAFLIEFIRQGVKYLR